MVNKSPVHVVEAKYSLEPSLDPKIPIRNKIHITKYKSTSIQDFQTTLFMLSIYLPAVVTHLFIFSPSWLSCMLCMSVWIYRLLGTWQGPVNISYPLCSLCNCFRRYTNRSSTEPRLYRNSLVVIHGNYFGPSCMDFPGHFPEIILGRLQHNFLCQIVSFIHWPHFSPVLYTIWIPEISWTRNKLHGKEKRTCFDSEKREHFLSNWITTADWEREWNSFYMERTWRIFGGEIHTLWFSLCFYIQMSENGHGTLFGQVAAPCSFNESNVLVLFPTFITSFCCVPTK